jgi:transposase
MANQLDPMDLKQILTLHLDKVSNRKIGLLLGISRNTVNEYISRFNSSEWSLDELISLGDKELKERFPAKTTIDNDRYDRLMRFFEKEKLSINHPGFTFQYHYQQYIHEVEDPYSYTQFMEHYHRKYSHEKGSLKLEHEPGKEVLIDFAGKKLHIVDRQTGEQIPVETFVAILPSSQYTYVEVFESQKREDLIPGLGNTFAYFGGVTKAIVSDNLKSAVTRSCKYEPYINRSLKEFALHYGCVINPTRTYSPQDKALVEHAVHLVYQRIYYPLRNMTFFSLKELNKEIRGLLEKYNDTLFQRKQASRKELFQSVERACLKPLPAQPYELKDYKRAKVQKMGYVLFSPDNNYYSVPYRYIGKRTMIHYTKSIVEIYFNHERIAIHHRSPGKGVYITNKDHLSSTHQAYVNWNPTYFKNLARKHGEYVFQYVSGMLSQSDYPEVNYKRSMGVIQLHKAHGSERLNNACKRALVSESFSYNMIKNILEKNLDKLELEQDLFSTEKSQIPEHENIRGASFYK